MVNQYCAHFFARNWQLPFLNRRKGENDCRKYFMNNLNEKTLQTLRGLNLRPDLQSDMHLTQPLKPDETLVYQILGFTVTIILYTSCNLKFKTLIWTVSWCEPGLFKWLISWLRQSEYPMFENPHTKLSSCAARLGSYLNRVFGKTHIS